MLYPAPGLRRSPDVNRVGDDPGLPLPEEVAQACEINFDAIDASLADGQLRARPLLELPNHQPVPEKNYAPGGRRPDLQTHLPARREADLVAHRLRLQGAVGGEAEAGRVAEDVEGDIAAPGAQRGDERVGGERL